MKLKDQRKKKFQFKSCGIWHNFEGENLLTKNATCIIEMHQTPEFFHLSNKELALLTIPTASLQRTEK